MNSVVAAHPNDPYTLLRLGEAWRNRAGLTTLLATFVCVAVLWVLGIASHSAALMALLALVSFVVYLLGFTAAGMQFMEQAAGNAVAGTLSALMASPMIVLRSLGLVLIIVVAWLAFALAAAILLLVCKIPFLGPILYVGVLPLLTFGGALVFLGNTVVSFLAAPALWEGQSLKSALSRLWAVVSQRPVEALLNVMLLFFVAGVISAIVSGVVFAGFGMTAGLSAGILGGQMTGGFGSLVGSMTGGMGGYGGGYGGDASSGGGLVIAGMLGGAIVFAVTVALVTAMFFLGLALVYLKLNVGVDAEAAEAAMDAAIAKTKERAQQAAEETRRRAQEAQAAAQRKLDEARLAQAQRSATAAAAAAAAAVVPPSPPAAPATAAEPPAAATNCPACGTPAAADDVFCGHCGHKLK